MIFSRPTQIAVAKTIVLFAAYFCLKIVLTESSSWLPTLVATPFIILTLLGAFADTLLRINQIESKPEPIPISNKVKMLQSMLQHTDCVMSLIDRNGTLLFNEGRGLRRLNMEDGAFVGLNIHDTFAGIDKIFAAFNRALNGETTTVNFEDETWEGGIYYVTYLPFPDVDGTINSVLAISQDVTETRKAELEIGEQRFRISQSARLSALGEMAAGISHEINNPVMIIYGSAQNLATAKKLGQLSDQLFATSLASIERNCERVSKIVRNMKALAADSDREQRQSTDLSLIIGDAADLVQKRMAHEKIKFTTEIPDHSEKILLRPTGILQVITNLLNNAIDAVKDSEDAWVRLRMEQHGDQTLIIVENSGPIITDMVVKKMFQPFFSTKAAGSGMGLGLSISERIVSRHQGQLILDNDSKNTRFVIQLPGKTAAAKVAA